MTAGRNRAAAAHPFLLGVMTDDVCRCELQQVILDPRLASARVALGRLTVDRLGTALDRLVAQQGNAPIVSWSTFDLEVIDADKDVRAPARRSVRTRHVNAHA